MKTLSKIILAVSLFFTMPALTSCKKAAVGNATNASPYYMKFKLDGVQKNYVIAGGQIIDTLIAGAAYGATIAGSPEDGSESMGLLIYSTTQITSGMTFNDDNVPGLILPKGNLNYVGDSGNSSYGSLAITNPGVQITLTELTSTYMKATFSGKMQDVSGSAILTVTDGELYAVRQQ